MGKYKNTMGKYTMGKYKNNMMVKLKVLDVHRLCVQHSSYFGNILLVWGIPCCGHCTTAPDRFTSLQQPLQQPQFPYVTVTFPSWPFRHDLSVKSSYILIIYQFYNWSLIHLFGLLSFFLLIIYHLFIYRVLISAHHDIWQSVPFKICPIEDSWVMSHAWDSIN